MTDNFAELQEQSPRDRIEFLKTDLALSFTLAGFAEAEHQTGNRTAASQALGEAEKGYSTVELPCGSQARQTHPSGDRPDSPRRVRPTPRARRRTGPADPAGAVHLSLLLRPRRQFS